MNRIIKWIFILGIIFLGLVIIKSFINPKQFKTTTKVEEKIEMPVEKTEILYNGTITCNIVLKTDRYTRVVTSEMLKDSDLMQIVARMSIPTSIVYFHLPDYVGSSQEYGWVIGTNAFVTNEFDARNMKKQTTPDTIKKKKVISDDPEFARRAFITSKDFVKERLTSPKSADFPFLDYKYSNVINNTIVIESYVDAKNAFNAEIRQNYRIKLNFTGGDWSDKNNWTVISLDFY